MTFESNLQAETVGTQYGSSMVNLAKSFTDTFSQARTLVQQHCNQYGLLTSRVGLAGATDSLMKQFQTWMDKL